MTQVERGEVYSMILTYKDKEALQQHLYYIAERLFSSAVNDPDNGFLTLKLLLQSGFGSTHCAAHTVYMILKLSIKLH
jgi:hypothetical protein